ncbi:MAG: sensor domain-containing protein, partial [Solirubrobacteraceae bacterium]
MGARPRSSRSHWAVRDLAYMALGLPLGLAYELLVVGGLLLGAVLGVVWLGLPVLVAATALVWRCAALERALANRLLRARIPPLAPLPVGAPDGAWA